MSNATPDPTAVPTLENRLGDQTSPYLRQHAGNPVPWQPWDAEALAAARELDRPILLSIGYATCYWCHVMERESFEDAAIGAALGEHFVPIKLDREQRPDLDEIYMTALQLLTGQGGWPLNVFLTPPGARGEDDPGLEPFYAGTYFPPRPAHGRPSFAQLLDGVAQAWRDRREEILDHAADLTAGLREHLERGGEPVRLDERNIGAALDILLRTHDRTNGGFGGAPKFPTPANLELLLIAGPWIQEDDFKDGARKALVRTLDAMAIGGINDHLAGGFHRYAVDEHWTVPHFEKMLYDNGQLASLYARASKGFSDEFYGDVAASICDWALREMRDEHGTFFSAIDAEVDAREGLNYIWRTEQIDELVTSGELDDSEANFAKRVFGLDRSPNFRDPHHPEDPPASVLRLHDRPDGLAKELGLTPERFRERFDRVRAAMLTARDRRKQPITDDKTIVAWNALMIEGLADTAAAMPAHERASVYLDAAERAADRLWSGMRHPQTGVMRRTARDGVIDETEGFFEDSALFVSALASLHHASGLHNRDGSVHIDRARDLVEAAVARFGEGPHKALMLDTPPGQRDLIVRTRSVHDGAMPSALAVWVNALHDLHQATNERALHERAVASLAAVSRGVHDAPAGTPGLARGLLRLMQIDGAVPDKIAPDDSKEATASPVTVFAGKDSVVVPRGGTAEVPIRIDIGAGYHINAADPGAASEEIGVVPLSVRVEGDPTLHASLDVPGGERYAGNAFGEPAADTPPLLVYTGQVEGTLTLSRDDAASDPPRSKPTIALTYQVCSDDACFNPITVALALEVN